MLDLVRVLNIVHDDTGLNVLLILIPFAWTSHFIRNKEDNWGPVATFVSSCLSVHVLLIAVTLPALTGPYVKLEHLQ